MSKPLTDAQLGALGEAAHQGFMVTKRSIDYYRATRDAIRQREVLRKTRERLRGLLTNATRGSILEAIEDIDTILGDRA